MNKCYITEYPLNIFGKRQLYAQTQSNVARQSPCMVKCGIHIDNPHSGPHQEHELQWTTSGT